MSSDWLSKLETRLERLEELAAARDVQIGPFLNAVEQAVAVVVAGESPEIWLCSDSEQDESVESASPPPTRPPRLFRRLNADGTTTLASSDQQQQLVSLADGVTGDQGMSEADGTLTFSASVTTSLQCLLTVPCQSLRVPSDSAAQACHSIATTAASLVARYLLEHNRRMQQVNSVLLQIAQRLAAEPGTVEISATIAHELGVLLPAGRVSVLIPQSGRLQPVAVSGVQEPNRDSETCRALASLAATLSDNGWVEIEHQRDRHPTVDVLYKQGMKFLRVIRLSDSSVAAGPVVILETSQSEERAGIDDAFVQQFASTVKPVLRRAAHRERSWVERLVPRRSYRWLAAATLVTAFLVFWPADFEVEVDGHVTAVNHRRIFAPDEGVVEEIYFEHRQQVEPGQPLLRLDNPDLLLEQRRIEGELQTTSAELSAVLAERLAADDPRLSAQERRLQSKLQSLEQQKTLVDRQSDLLHVNAPFAGRVFRHHPQQDLLDRPVQRGQLLLELVPTDGDWQLEMLIPDHLEHYVREAMQHRGDDLAVRYQIRSSPDIEWTSQLDHLDSVLQVRDGKSVCRATADLTAHAVANLRPGSSVTARIHCGIRPVGFVWFRELIHYWHAARFAWL